MPRADSERTGLDRKSREPSDTMALGGSTKVGSVLSSPFSLAEGREQEFETERRRERKERALSEASNDDDDDDDDDDDQWTRAVALMTEILLKILCKIAMAEW